MENVVAGQNLHNIFDEFIVENTCIDNFAIILPDSKSTKFKLSSKVRYVDELNNGHLLLNDELADKTVYKIVCELALAIDKNQPLEVKRIKQRYSSTPEFVKAKIFLNRLCKQVWDVFENRSIKMEIPSEAFKALGITNKPSLEFLLSDSIKYYEKDNGQTTANLIASILENKNLNYTFDDIFEYLKSAHAKEKCEYNLNTFKCIAKKVDYNKKKLLYLGIQKEQYKQIMKSVPIAKQIGLGMKNLAKVCKVL